MIIESSPRIRSKSFFLRTLTQEGLLQIGKQLSDLSSFLSPQLISLSTLAARLSLRSIYSMPLHMPEDLCNYVPVKLS